MHMHDKPHKNQHWINKSH